MVLVGGFITRAAIRFRPSDAQGFDGTLREVTELAIGPLGDRATDPTAYGVRHARGTLSARKCAGHGQDSSAAA